MKSIAIKTLILLLLFTVGFSQNDDNQPVTVTQLTEYIYKITSTANDFGVNSLAFIGDDGVLLVDNGYQNTASDFAAAIQAISSKNVKLIINSHAHNDHFGGNRSFTKDAVVIAHKNARGEILGEYFNLPAIAEQEIPIVTINYETTIYFYGEEIQIIPLIGGHTNSDLIVYFPEAKVCYGGIIYANNFPFIDIGRGGNALNYPENVEKLIQILPDDVKIITAHLDDYSIDDLKRHYKMLTNTIEIVTNEKETGKTVEEMIEENVLKDYKDWTKGPFSSTNAFINGIYNSLLGEEGIPKKTIAAPLTKIIVSDGVKPAIKYYHKLKESEPDKYNYSEGALNMLGYQLIFRNMYDEAIEILKLNVEMFPEAFNTYDSLGEAYMLNGQNKLAKKNYKKSLKFNPENTNATDKLKELEG